jgi:hypothetical protein
MNGLSFGRTVIVLVGIYFLTASTMINSVDVLTPVCSTHAPVLDEISFKTSKQHSFKKHIRNYNAADIEGLADELNITNWNDLVFNSDNITVSYT